MPPIDPAHAALLPLLPEDRVGAVERIEAVRAGLSGAGVYAVTTARGAYVLRVQARERSPEYFAQQLLVLRRAANAGIAPAIAHVDEAARAVVSARVPGVPLGAALADPARRGRVLGSIVDQLRALHSLEPAGVAERDPLDRARAEWASGRARQGFPAWAQDLAATFTAIEAALAADPRRSVSHNDVNPSNILWDGARAWLIDWEVTGVNHPYYDLATLALFMRLDSELALQLAARHDGAPLDERARSTFAALRQLAGLLAGLTFLSLVKDLSVRPAPTPADAPSLRSCYQALSAGELELQSPLGQASMGLALLAESGAFR